MRARSTGTAAALAALALVGGCAPAPEAQPELDPSWVAHAVGPVVVHAPADWTDLGGSDLVAGTDSDLNALIGVADDGSVARPGVTVTVLGEPTRDAAAEAQALVTREEATRGANDVTVEEVDRAGAATAIEVSLWSEFRSVDGPVEVASRWLVADLSTGEQVLVGVLGPRADFAELPLDEVLDAVELTA